MSAVAALLADGRLHLQHGPIDCLCRAWGEPEAVQAAYGRAARFFTTVLDDLCAELPILRTALPTPLPSGAIAQAMHAACMPFADRFITPMAAVAGAVADGVLAAMVKRDDLSRAFVNNGGDIAFHLAPATSLRCGLVTDLAAPSLDGAFLLTAEHPARGLATSGRACKGRGGRSFSLGIADSVSVLARTAAQADAAATIIGNAVDLPGHAAVQRLPASAIDPASDLGDRLVTVDVGSLDAAGIDAALDAGEAMADALIRAGLIDGAVLALRGSLRVVDPSHALLEAV
jgi:ApbE superfamily uncharacterized protein (UPF0280 family)